MNVHKTVIVRLLAAAVCILMLSVAGSIFAQQTSEGQNATEKQTTAQQHGPWFTDRDGDGYHDYAPDHDGDGIPNGSDPDYTRPGRGAGRGMGSAAAATVKRTTSVQGVNRPAKNPQSQPAATARGTWRTTRGVQGWARPEPKEHGPWFVDKNGDGYHDYAPDADGDGVPNGRDTDYVRPRNATGRFAAGGGFSGRGAGGGRGRGWRR